MEEGLKKAIIKTREYGKRFGVEYTDDEIYERLISRKIYKIFNLQTTNYNNSNHVRKMETAKKLAKEIGKQFPNILFIGVTGSVAAGRPPENSDIDLMIITKKDSLWVTRLVLRLYVKLRAIPHRKYGETEKSNEFCFNLWMEEDKLCLPTGKQNLQNAMDLILMKPILNRDNIYEEFIAENKWAKKYVINGYSNLVTSYAMPAGRQELRVTSYKTNRLASFINWLVFWPQWWYMKRKVGKGFVNKKMAFFHPNGG